MVRNKIIAQTTNKDWALLYGIMLGDGCLSCSIGQYSYGIEIVGSYEHDQPFFAQIVVPAINKFRSRPIRILKYPQTGSIKIKIKDKKLFTKFKVAGFPIGKKGLSLSLPRTFLESKNLLRYIIQGLFATDGSLVLTKNPNKYYPRIEFTSISKRLMSQVNEYLSKKGVRGKVYFKKRLNQRYRHEKDFYRIQINGTKKLLLFKNKIGFINPKHIKKFSLFYAYSRRYDNAIKGVSNRKQKFFRIKDLGGVGEI